LVPSSGSLGGGGNTIGSWMGYYLTQSALHDLMTSLVTYDLILLYPASSLSLRTSETMDWEVTYLRISWRWLQQLIHIMCLHSKALVAETFLKVLSQ